MDDTPLANRSRIKMRGRARWMAGLLVVAAGAHTYLFAAAKRELLWTTLE